MTVRRRASDRSDLSAGSLRSGHGVKFLSACVAALALSACAKKAAESTAPESSDMAAVPDDIDALERELDLRERQMTQLGAGRSAGSVAAGGGGQALGKTAARSGDDRKGENKLAGAGEAGADMSAAEAQTSPVAPTSAPEPGPARDLAQNRCMTVCDLSTSICQLQDRICDLAPRHPNEPRYQAACERAARDCQSSQEACHDCA